MALAISATIARAVDDIELTLDAIASEQWSAKNLHAQLTLLPQGQRATLTIESLRFMGSDEPIRTIRIDCGELEISAHAFACRDGNVTAHVPGMGEQRFTAVVRYGRSDASLEFDIREWRVGAGALSLTASLHDDAWQTSAQLQNVAIADIAKLATAFDVALPLQATSGTLTATLRARGAASSVAHLSAQGEFNAVSLNNEAGSLASDQATMGFEVDASRESQGWRYTIAADATAGQAYAEPVFIDFGAHQLRATAHGTFSDTGTLIAERFQIYHVGALNASGRGTFDFEHEQPVRDLQVELTQLQFPGAYESYLQPFLLDTNFKSLQTSGALSGALAISEGVPTKIELALAQLNVAGGDLQIADLSGALNWQMVASSDEESTARPASVEISHLNWAGGALFGLEFGASELRFTLNQRNVRLLEPARIPFLDGALQLDSLRIRNAGMPTVAFLIDATIEPVSVQRLCRAFGWPEFGGQLGGTISKLRMREGIVTLGTTLEAQVFDGQVRVSDLRLEEPFSKWPRFHSSIELNNLDLELVTSAFSFGRITGRLSGAVRDLQMFNWSPVAFDARLFTPPNDRSRRRISQRAVENIGSMGGGSAGVTAALSSGFLRFFDDFNYRRLGISCRLRNEVCEMDGAAPAPNGGYYLVEGRGVPRIDVIGNSRRVDWPRLVRQLIEATESSGPVVQ